MEPKPLDFWETERNKTSVKHPENLRRKENNCIRRWAD